MNLTKKKNEIKQKTRVSFSTGSFTTLYGIPIRHQEQV